MEETINYPLITVIINNYNNLRFFKRAINSVISQTYSHLEILIVDDCSTNEKIYQLYKKYQLLDKRIKIVYNQKNKQLFNSRLVGIENATGQYVTFLDGDDAYDVDFIRHMYFLLLQFQADLVCCNFCYVVENNYMIDHKQKFFQTEYEKTKQNLLHFLFDSQGASFAANFMWNKLYKKTVLIHAYNEIQQTELIHQKIHTSEDLLLNSFVLKYATKIHIDPNYIGNYYRRSKPVEIATKKEKDLWIKEIDQAFNWIFQYCLKDIKQQDSVLFSNFTQFVINTFAQHITLLSLNIKEIDFSQTIQYLNYASVEQLKKIILEKKEWWFFPKVLRFHNHLSDWKKTLRRSKNVIFNLENGLFFDCTEEKNFILNEQVYDLFNLAFFLKKKIIIFYKDFNLLKKFQNLTPNWLWNVNNISFQNTKIKLSYNFVLNKKFFSFFNKNNLVKNKKLKQLFLSHNWNINEQKKFAIFYWYALIATQNCYDLHRNTFFNYSYPFFFCLILSVLNQPIDEWNNNQFAKTYFLVLFNSKKIHDNVFYWFEQQLAFKLQKIFISYLQNLNLNFDNKWKMKLFDLIFNNLKFDYEINSYIPQNLTIENQTLNLNQLWHDWYWHFDSKFQNYRNSEMNFFKLLSYAVIDKDIFNNESYMYFRKKPSYLKLGFKLMKRKIKSN